MPADPTHITNEKQVLYRFPPLFLFFVLPPPCRLHSSSPASQFLYSFIILVLSCKYILVVRICPGFPLFIHGLFPPLLHIFFSVRLRNEQNDF